MVWEFVSPAVAILFLEESDDPGIGCIYCLHGPVQTQGKLVVNICQSVPVKCTYTCACHMYMSHVHVTCACHMCMSHVHVICACHMCMAIWGVG